MFFSVIVIPDISTGVFACRPVKVARTSGPGFSQNGLLSLFSSLRKLRICGSMLGSVAGSTATIVCDIAIVAPIRIKTIETYFIFAPALVGFKWDVTRFVSIVLLVTCAFPSKLAMTIGCLDVHYADPRAAAACVVLPSWQASE